MILGPPGDDGNDDGPLDPFDESANEDAQRAELDDKARLLQERWANSDIEAKLMELGIYLEQQSIVPIPTQDGLVIGLAVLGTVNKVAFSTRVLDPEQAKMDRDFRHIDHGAKADEFLDTRERMKRNIQAGRDPLDDGPEA